MDLFQVFVICSTTSKVTRYNGLTQNNEILPPFINFTTVVEVVYGVILVCITRSISQYFHCLLNIKIGAKVSVIFHIKSIDVGQARSWGFPLPSFLNDNLLFGTEICALFRGRRSKNKQDFCYAITAFYQKCHSFSVNTVSQNRNQCLYCDNH